MNSGLVFSSFTTRRKKAKKKWGKKRGSRPCYILFYCDLAAYITQAYQKEKKGLPGLEVFVHCMRRNQKKTFNTKRICVWSTEKRDSLSFVKKTSHPGRQPSQNQNKRFLQRGKWNEWVFSRGGGGGGGLLYGMCNYSKNDWILMMILSCFIEIVLSAPNALIIIVHILLAYYYCKQWAWRNIICYTCNK